MLTAALALVASSCLAGPAGSAHDPVMQLLQERGLVQANSGPAASPPPADPTLLSQVREKTTDLVLGAMNFIGVRYRRGGTTAENGFDCSGFTRYVFENSIGLVLPRRADEQARAPGLFSIGKDELKPGDLVFFNTVRRTFSHVGIYIGDGKFIHSPRAGGEVRIEDMRVDYWAKRFNGARRAPQAGGEMPHASPS
ncbi:MAG TPA: C40 family peptidase [Ideonella sp.]|jgi:cell wall-associated NlpC family hydrolase|nr:C40 family peptidase [Ideonella sp.]